MPDWAIFLIVMSIFLGGGALIALWFMCALAGDIDQQDEDNGIARRS